MDQIIFLINCIELSDIQPSEYLTHDYSEVREIADLANKHLITDKSECNWDNINFLKEKGFNVFPVEQDSFGWMLGGISTSKGVIVYG